MGEPKLKYSVRDKTPIHFSVGAIIRNDKGEILLIDRLKPPFGFACPAGHVDDTDKNDEEAVLREVTEETGLTVTSIKYIDTSEFDINAPQEPCSRGIGTHIWNLFEVEASGDLIFKADEVKSIGWYSVEQIKDLPLESIWKFWLTNLNII